jgi:hypothetical protein
MSTKKRWRNSPFFVFYYIYYKTFMKKNLFVINENEKDRIINMHKNATKNLYIPQNKILTEEKFQTVKIQLPDGPYIGSGQGYEYKLLTPDKKDTGYTVMSTTPFRGTVTDDPVTISSGITTSKTWGVGGDYYYEAPISNAGSTQQVVGQQENPTRYKRGACETGTIQDCALAIQQRMNDECKLDILNATLVNFPKARTGTEGNFKLKEDSKLGSGTKAVIAACNLPKLAKVGATTITSQSSGLNPTIPVGGTLTDNDIMTLMNQ